MLGHEAPKKRSLHFQTCLVQGPPHHRPVLS